MAVEETFGSESSAEPAYTKQDLSVWKRREKGRLTKLRHYLIENPDLDRSPSFLQRKVEEAQKPIKVAKKTIKVTSQTLVSTKPEFDRLTKATTETRDQFLDRSARRRYLTAHISALSFQIERKIFTSKLNREKSECEIELADLEMVEEEKWRSEMRAVELLQQKTEAALQEAKATLAEAKATLAEAETTLAGEKATHKALLKFQEWVRSAVPQTLLTKHNGSSLLKIVDRRLANLEKDLLPPEEEDALVAYAKEKKATKAEKEAKKEVEKAERAKKKAEKQAENAREASRLRRKVARDTKKILELEASESSRLKQNDKLQTRLGREEERLEVDREDVASDMAAHHQDLQRKHTDPFEYWSDRVPASQWEWWNSKRGPKQDHLIPKLRTRSRKIEELSRDLKSLKEDQKRLRSLRDEVREDEKALAAAERASGKAPGGNWPVGKAPRIGYIRDAHAFEKFMAKWMRWLGWEDAKAMPVGPDEGIDIKAKGALGQAKHWDHEVGIEEVQRHNGVCEGLPKHGRVFLAKNGYTPQAIKWANERGLPLFEMKAGNKDAGVVGSTKAAKKLLEVGAKAMGKSKGK